MPLGATDLEAFLKALGLDRYARALAENDVDLETLPHLTDQDLKELGLSLGHRRKLLSALGEQTPAGPAADVQSPVVPPAAVPEARGMDDAERRQLTVLFCDLAGSTELAGLLEPEELRDVMTRYHDAVTGAVEAHEGHVAKLLGDGVLAYFGWPRAHEAQAERAVRAALAAVAAVSRLEAAGKPLAARAGIATGPVVIGDMVGTSARESGAVTGATPNLAARLQELAQPGETLIHMGTRQLIGASFALEEAGEHRLKGFADPVAVWRVVSATRTDSRFEALHGGGLTEFVGRVHEVDLLVDRWRQAQGGEGQVVLVSGEAGIGKSRMLRQFMGKLEASAQLLRYQCSPHEINTAFHPLLEEIEGTAGFLPDDTVERRLDRLEEHLADVFAQPGEALPLLAELLSLPLDRYPPVEMAPQRRRQRTVALLAERIVRLAHSAPMALLIEDVHWIDPSSLEVLHAMVPRLRDLPALAAITFRPGFATGWSDFGHVTMLSLNRLGRGERRAIARHVAGKTLPEAVLDRIVEQTDGIPLFVEELTKAVLEAGVLQEQDDRYIATGPLPWVAIPASLQDSLMARLDRLAPVKRVVQAGACIGREFDADLLAAALPMDRDELDDALEQLLEAQLIFRHGGTDASRYVFKHALVQDAAYSSLLLSTRKKLHERLALALERTGTAEPLELARHFAGAGLNDRASALYLDAGRRALATSALPEAIAALELGLEAGATLEPSNDCGRRELDLRVALGAARMASFGWAHQSVSEALEPAFPLAQALDDHEAAGSILWGLWVHCQTRAEFPRAHGWLDQLEAAARQKPASDLPVIFDMSAGCQLFWEADYPGAIAHTDHLQAIYVRERHARLAASTNHDPLVFAQHWAGSLAEWIRGFPERSLERMEDAIELARAVGHPFNLVFALTAGSTSLIYLDEVDRLLAHCDEAEGVVKEEALGAFSEHVNVMQWRGGAHVQRGDYEAGYELARRGNAFWTESDGRICTAMFRSWMVRGLQGLGRVGEAIELNGGNIEHCRRTGDRYMEPECVRLQGELMLAASPADAEAAERLFIEAMELADAHGARSWQLRAATSLARLCRAQGRGGEAVACLEPVLTAFKEGRETPDLRGARKLLEVP